MAESLGEALRARRKAARLTQEEVARRLGVSRPTLTQWEANKHRPTEEHLSSLDRIYGAHGGLITQDERVDAAAGTTRYALADVFGQVGDSLLGRMLRDEHGRPRGWSRNLVNDGVVRPATPFSTAFALRTLQLLDDARGDQHAIAEALLERRGPGGWHNRAGQDARPEVTATVLTALARLGALTDVDADLAMLENSIDRYTRRRPYILATVLEAVVSIRPDAPLVEQLTDDLLNARTDFGGRLLWSVDAGAPHVLVEPSPAHTARCAATLRLVRPFLRYAEAEDAVAAAVDWLVDPDMSDDGTTETLQPDPDNRSSDIPTNHFTAAWTIRALAGVEGVPATRLQSALDTLWAGYSPEAKLWAWRADGTLPCWMTHDAVSALRYQTLQATVTPVDKS